MDVPLEFEDEQIVAFNDIKPAAPAHVLIVPKKHLSSANDLTGETALLVGRMIVTAKDIARKKGIYKKGYRLVLNCGEDGGQAVGHIHIHLIGGRKLAWPPG
ncbi:MAG: HIT domain-containing protein [Candidatus Omnitrophica bacterium]|nr:HIT domain-containing protein [Candidatus Omnitrophota bacterium]